MSDALIHLSLFTAKLFIVFLFILIFLIVFFLILSKGKEKLKERLIIKNLNHKYDEHTEALLSETLSKKDFKAFLKNKVKDEEQKKKVYVINFNGDIKASAVSSLREEITTIINVATPQDEVVLRLESPGGIVHGYGLAAAQLMRLKAKQIPLTISVDKIAASGGYLMACVANKIIAAPFAIIGSIGVIVQLPNFHRLLKEKQIDFEQHTAGEFKRTLTLFGENTPEGREKLQEEIETVHQLFKQLISENRPALDINQVATGEHWVGIQALELKLVDEIKTSDEYLLELSKTAQLYEISYEVKKSFLSRFSLSSSSSLRQKIFPLY